MLDQQKSETIRLLQWIRENRDDWDKICGRGDPSDLSDDDMHRILTTIIDQSFYQIALVLIASFDIRPRSHRAVFTAFIDTLLERETGDGVEYYINKIAKNFQ